MRFIKFFLLTNLLLATSSLYAQGRAPAVEDFVGVETQDYTPAPEGTEFFFNFDENQITDTSSELAPTQEQTPFELPLIITLAVIALPFIMWFGIQHSMKNIPLNKEDTHADEHGHLDNVEFLEVYQQEKKKLATDLHQNQEKDDDEKKAS